MKLRSEMFCHISADVSATRLASRCHFDTV